MEMLFGVIGVVVITLLIVWNNLKESEPELKIAAIGREYYQMPDGAKMLIFFDFNTAGWAVKFVGAGRRKPCSRTLFLNDNLKQELVSDIFTRGGRRLE